MDMIEKIARVLADGTYDHHDTEPDDRRRYRQQAEMCLDAIRKPTEKMIRAANSFTNYPADDVFGEALIKYVMMVAISEGLQIENDR